MDANETVALIIGLLATGGLAVGAFYVLRRIRRRQALTRAGGIPRPEVASDRAYNRLAMARREADVLQAQGTDVARARDLIGLADASFRNREFDRAFELAQAAHETLVNLRRSSAGPVPRRPVSGTVPSEAGPARTPPPVGLPDLSPRPPPEGPAPTVLPKNKLESQFQIRLLEGELGARASAPAAAEARGALEQAKAAFSREEFTEALRLALKARRQLGGTVETLKPSAIPGIAPGGGALPDEVQASAERASAAARCTRCGTPVVAGDGFCRGCGAPIGSPGCPKCGASRSPADAFCGKCGFRYG